MRKIKIFFLVSLVFNARLLENYLTLDVYTNSVYGGMFALITHNSH